MSSLIISYVFNIVLNSAVLFVCFPFIFSDKFLLSFIPKYIPIAPVLSFIPLFRQEPSV